MLGGGPLKMKLIPQPQMRFFFKNTFWRKISGFPENSPTSINHNFLTTEPILKVKDVLESYESESFISGI